MFHVINVFDVNLTNVATVKRKQFKLIKSAKIVWCILHRCEHK